MEETLDRKTLINAAVRALTLVGLKPTKSRGRGGQIWTIEEEGRLKHLAIRTTRDRCIAFNPQPNHCWKTLDEVEIVIVAAVDHVDSPDSSPRLPLRRRGSAKAVQRVLRRHDRQREQGVVQCRVVGPPRQDSPEPRRRRNRSNA